MPLSKLKEIYPKIKIDEQLDRINKIDISINRIEKIDTPVRIALIGQFGAGKSTLFNEIAKKYTNLKAEGKLRKTGPYPTDMNIVLYSYSNRNDYNLHLYNKELYKDDVWVMSSNSKFFNDICLIDTPGIDDTGGAENLTDDSVRDKFEIVNNFLDEIDYIFYCIPESKPITDRDYDMMHKILNDHKNIEIKIIITSAQKLLKRRLTDKNELIITPEFDEDRLEEFLGEEGFNSRILSIAKNKNHDDLLIKKMAKENIKVDEIKDFYYTYDEEIPVANERIFDMINNLAKNKNEIHKNARTFCYEKIIGEISDIRKSVEEIYKNKNDENIKRINNLREALGYEKDRIRKIKNNVEEMFRTNRNKLRNINDLEIKISLDPLSKEDYSVFQNSEFHYSIKHVVNIEQYINQAIEEEENEYLNEFEEYFAQYVYKNMFLILKRKKDLKLTEYKLKEVHFKFESMQEIVKQKSEEKFISLIQNEKELFSNSKSELENVFENSKKVRLEYIDYSHCIIYIKNTIKEAIEKIIANIDKTYPEHYKKRELEDIVDDMNFNTEAKLKDAFDLRKRVKDVEEFAEINIKNVDYNILRYEINSSVFSRIFNDIYLKSDEIKYFLENLKTSFSRKYKLMTEKYDKRSKVYFLYSLFLSSATTIPISLGVSKNINFSNDVFWNIISIGIFIFVGFCSAFDFLSQKFIIFGLKDEIELLRKELKVDISRFDIKKAADSIDKSFYEGIIKVSKSEMESKTQKVNDSINKYNVQLNKKIMETRTNMNKEIEESIREIYISIENDILNELIEINKDISKRIETILENIEREILNKNTERYEKALEIITNVERGYMNL